MVKLLSQIEDKKHGAMEVFYADVLAGSSAPLMASVKAKGKAKAKAKGS